MNIYYKVYLKEFDNSESDFYILFISNGYAYIEGQVLKINSLCTADKRKETEINGTYNFSNRFYYLVTDLNVIRELDKLATFQ